MAGVGEKLPGSVPFDLAKYDSHPALASMLRQQLAAFPNHLHYLERRFAQRDDVTLRFEDLIAQKITLIARGKLNELCDDYRWLCEELLNEELHFVRTGRYRLSTFADAANAVYANPNYMKRYLNGLLASQLWWRNHTEVLRLFCEIFLPQNPLDFSHLEVGPGHGLYLHFAASAPNCKCATAWDISDTSLNSTRASLAALGTARRVLLERVDLFAAPKRTFDSIVFSEVLEHLEDPAAALSVLFGLLSQGGRIFINVPVNSPAPDHIFLFSAPEEVVRIVERAGFRIVKTLFAPGAGASLTSARKLRLAISTAVIATK